MSTTPAERTPQPSASPSPSPEDNSKLSRRLQREREREERLRGKLIDLTFSDIACVRGGKPDFIKQNVLVCIQGSKSQFDARLGRMRDILPPLTCDCCQTFSTLSAVLLSSLGFAAMLSECHSLSTVNYLLYISAWMHQLTLPCWPQKRERPTIGDLNACLHLRDFFPSKANADEFEVVFYNQGTKAIQLLHAMCASRKRTRSSEGVYPVYGYVIVSGDYTVSIFAVEHDIAKNSKSRYREAWSFYICDSHGTQPWSEGKASISGLTFGHRAHDIDVDAAENFSGSVEDGGAVSVVSVDDGVHYFSTILFTLLEEHRKGAQRTNQIPYMTWTPLRRRRALAYTAQELKKIIDSHWIPKVLSNPVVRAEAKKFSFVPLECFWGIVPESGTAATPTRKTNANT
ncbi:hypothetical protein ABB37_00772 [Leptomonas pyrrhocoris]|uniref:Uncharacterized protein n=1 Tax=Leptomonas pyrrhocoris TaxID=157538 RepID=A0A0M9GB37_LEPPY|nr:hypothetical protein ABB37_00772 [Leptomonas pyrrhocoris]KPA86673.1 hypothetical protein ABB37_00772 [Leptomonas pyrrhocoris]|eukprot:XP_015665112.1 hypothetical protein ABB37_00772 [Leptomonas pyrrhocoris]